MSGCSYCGEKVTFFLKNNKTTDVYFDDSILFKILKQKEDLEKNNIDIEVILLGFKSYVKLMHALYSKTTTGKDRCEFEFADFNNHDDEFFYLYGCKVIVSPGDENSISFVPRSPWNVISA